MKLAPVNNNVDKFIADRFRELIRHLPDSYTDLLTELRTAENSLRSQYSPNNQKECVTTYRLALEQSATVGWLHGLHGGPAARLTTYPPARNRTWRRITALQRLIFTGAQDMGTAEGNKARAVGQRKRLDTTATPAETPRA